MKKMRSAALLALFWLSFLFFIRVSHAVEPTRIRDTISEPTKWTKEGGPYLVSGQVVVKAPLTIEAGTVVKFGIYNNSLLSIQSDLFVNGTSSEKVIFTSNRDDVGGDTGGGNYKPLIGDWAQISIGPLKENEVRIRHAEVKYSAFGIRLGGYPQAKGVSIKNSKLSQNGYGFLIKDTNAVIENNEISDNIEGIKIYLTKGTTKITNNSIFGNETGAKAQNDAEPAQIFLDARGNWWGDEDGPENANNPDGKGDKVIGNVLFDPWIEENPIQNPDPVIIIPGIMGSWKKDGKWRIDPIFHAYDNLCEEFLANGYEDGKNFSVFPYEWRDSNIENAKLLRDRINVIKEETGRPKVDIVAHSMGGLLAREYIESTYYQNDVDQLITVGTPHLGAPKDYVTWEAGEFLGFWSPVLKRIIALEALENGFLDIFHYIHNPENPMKSVEELLPVYNYLYDENGDDYILRNTYPENYPRNEFLENLNKDENTKVLENVEFTKIIGKTSSESSTISGYNVTDGNISGLWLDGYPKYFNIPVLNRQGIIKSSGDASILPSSATLTV